MGAEQGGTHRRASSRTGVDTHPPCRPILVVVIILLYVLFTTALVDGVSMFPTLEDGDYLLVERGYEHPLRGDVIVYEGRDFDGTSDTGRQTRHRRPR